MPVAEAVRYVRELVARAEVERQAAERAHAAQLDRYRPSTDHDRTGPKRDFGPSL